MSETSNTEQLNQRTAELENKTKELQRQLRQKQFRQGIDSVLYVTIAVAIGILFYTVARRAFSDAEADKNRSITFSPPYAGALTETDSTIVNQTADILARAEASQSSAERVLNFLEGASILIGGAVAVAAIYGFRNAQETRNELRKELEDLTRLHNQVRDAMPLLKDLDGKLKTLDLQQTKFEGAQTKIDRLEKLSSEIDQRIEDMMFALSNLIQANQELMLNNYNEAYADVLHVLDSLPENPLALYIAGWIEFQYMENKFEAGLARMEQAFKLAPDNPTIMAAYGIVLRRQAVKDETPPLQREQLFSEAESLLLKALNANPRLLDMNRESFWGPVAGLRRDQGRLEKAIEAYKNAVEVTPGSAYPRGNLAALLLCRHRAKGDPDSLDEAMRHFRGTLTYAQREFAASSNDYYDLMDIVMARTILGSEDQNHLIYALTQLDDVLALRPTVEMLQTSRRGWYFLMQAAPVQPGGWTLVQRGIKKAIHKIEAMIVEQGGTPLDIKPTPLCGDSPQETTNDAP